MEEKIIYPEQPDPGSAEFPFAVESINKILEAFKVNIAFEEVKYSDFDIKEEAEQLLPSLYALNRMDDFDCELNEPESQLATGTNNKKQENYSDIQPSRFTNYIELISILASTIQPCEAYPEEFSYLERVTEALSILIHVCQLKVNRINNNISSGTKSVSINFKPSDSNIADLKEMIPTERDNSNMRMALILLICEGRNQKIYNDFNHAFVHTIDKPDKSGFTEVIYQIYDSRMFLDQGNQPNLYFNYEIQESNSFIYVEN